MVGAANFMPSITARTRTAISWSYSPMSRSTMLRCGMPVPALLNITSSRPKRAAVPSISVRSSESSATFVCTKLADWPRRPASASPSSRRRPAITTVAPSSTNSSAVRAPIPLVPPVTIAILPSSAAIVGFSLFWHDCYAAPCGLQSQFRVAPLEPTFHIWAGDPPVSGGVRRQSIWRNPRRKSTKCRSRRRIVVQQ